MKISIVQDNKKIKTFTEEKNMDTVPVYNRNIHIVDPNKKQDGKDSPSPVEKPDTPNTQSANPNISKDDYINQGEEDKKIYQQNDQTPVEIDRIKIKIDSDDDQKEVVADFSTTSNSSESVTDAY